MSYTCGFHSNYHHSTTVHITVESHQVVDNSSAFRMDDGVPLVIPEVNPDAMAGMKPGQGGIIANPNCSTIIALMAVTPLHRASKVKRMVVSTYQVSVDFVVPFPVGFE